MFSGVRRALGRSAAVRVGGGLLILIVGACVLVPFFWPDGTNAFVTAPFAPPSLAHPFGSDDLGRDVFVRTLAGGRIDIAVAAAVVAISCMAGTIIGACAGASRHRWANLTVARIVDAFIAFPYLVTILVLVVIVGPERADRPRAARPDRRAHRLPGAGLDVLRPAGPGRGDDHPPARLHRGGRDPRLPTQ